LKFADVLARITVGRAVLIGMLLSAFYYFLVFDSGMTQEAGITQGGTTVATLQAQLVDYQKKLDSAAVYKKTAAEVGNTINKLLTLIPEKFGMSDLMKIVSNEAKVAGSSLMKIEPKNTTISTIATEFEELILTIELQGSFLQHMVFLSNLTKINQILIIRKFEMIHSRDGKGDESPTVAMNAEIAAFRYRGIDATKTTPGVPGTPPSGGKK
jgi:Tfp pilus assembly protein PilO